jgi:ABC-type hemin transport system substrate-binding protein
VLIAGHLAQTPRTLRILGGLLEVQQRAETLALYAEAVLSRVHTQISKIPPAERPTLISLAVPMAWKAPSPILVVDPDQGRVARGSG